MVKSKDFIFEEVMDVSGKRLGYIKDLIVDFGDLKVLGFKIIPYKLMKKDLYIVKEDIIYQNTSMIASKTVEGKFLELGSIINMHVVDRRFNVIGLISEIIFNGETFSIKGVYIKNSSIFAAFKERRIILMRDLIIGEKYAIYTGSCSVIEMKCIPAFEDINRKDLYYEKDSI